MSVIKAWRQNARVAQETRFSRSHVIFSNPNPPIKVVPFHAPPSEKNLDDLFD